MVNDIIATGSYRGAPSLGITVTTVEKDGGGTQVQVMEVSAGSGAADAGIQAGDIITRLGDAEITGYSDLKQAIKQYSAGDSAELELYRAGESRTLTVIFDEAVPDSANP